MSETLIPDSTITSGVWVPVGDLTIHQVIDEGVDSHDSDTTYAQATTNGTFRVTFSNVVDSNLYTRLVIRLVAKVDVDTQVVLVDPVINALSLGQQCVSIGTIYSVYEFEYAGDWSDVDMNTLEIEVNSGGALQDTRLTALEAVVFSPAEGASTVDAGGTMPIGVGD